MSEIDESTARAGGPCAPAPAPPDRPGPGTAYRLFAADPLAPALAPGGHWTLTHDRDGADAVLVPGNGTPEWLAPYRREHPLTPVVVVGPHGEDEEIHAPDHGAHALAPVLARIEPVLAAFAELPPEVVRALPSDSHLAAAAWLWTRGRRVEVRVGERFAGGFAYPCEGSVPDAAAVLESLAAAGYLDRHLAEVAHACPQCESLHLWLRDTCRECASIDVFEEPLVHHFRCAYQGPESGFTTAGGDYVCPKCRKALRHFGMDYDKPGSLMICRACGHESHETVVRGRCLHCDHRFDAERSRRRGLYDYALNDAGVHALFQGAMRPPDPKEFLGDTLSLETPRTFVAIASRLAAIEERHELPTLFLEIDLEQAEAQTDSLGARIRLVTLIGRELAALLRPTDVVAYSVGRLWVLLPGSDASAAGRIEARLAQAIRDTFQAAVADQVRLRARPVRDWLGSLAEA